MADICDEYGNPIQLTDEHGRQVQLTDEHGVPVHLTGVATTVDSVQRAGTTAGPETHGGTHFAPTVTEPVVGDGVGVGVETGGQIPCHMRVDDAEGGTQQPPGSSSSSSSEDDGEGGRMRKKKGLMQKMKEKLPGHKNKEEIVPEKVYTATTKVTVTTPAGPLDVPKTESIRVEHHEEEHEKKGFINKIMDKLPGHH
ncbi:putative dehydrin [Helianthus anomalus]